MVLSYQGAANNSYVIVCVYYEPSLPGWTVRWALTGRSSKPDYYEPLAILDW